LGRPRNSLASIGKPFTAAGLMTLVEQKRIEPDVLVAADSGGAIGKSIRSFKKSFPCRFSDDSTFWTSGKTLHRASLIHAGAFHAGGSTT
jgi:hypothetical protein